MAGASSKEPVANSQDRLLPGGTARLTAGHGGRGPQGTVLGARAMGQRVMGVMLECQLQQATGLLDQQVDLGGQVRGWVSDRME